MKKKTWKVYAVWIAVTEAVGFLSGFLTRNAAKRYPQTVNQPPLSPPMWVFPVVWTALFALMGVGAARIYRKEKSKERRRALGLFWAQLGFNFLWSILFFNLRWFGFALLWLLGLWVLIANMIAAFRKVDHTAAWLQVPYLLWVTFAAYLNAGVWALNRG